MLDAGLHCWRYNNYMKRRWLKYTGIALIACYALVYVGLAIDRRNIEASQPVVQKTVEAPEVPEEPKISVQGLLEATNKERKKAGVKPLILDERLNASAQMKIKDLEVDGWSHNPHVSSDGKDGYTYIFDFAIECTYGSENLATVLNNEHHNTSAQGATKTWLNSEKHKEALLNERYEFVGFAYNDGFVVQHFCDID
jgi:uncharacterized protein YkwD